MKYPTTKDEAYEVLMQERRDLARRKNADYGNDNISVTGLIGIAVRLVDKAMRLYNLTQREGQVKDETIEDTLRDIANYGDIGAMLQMGWWNLPWDDTERICIDFSSRDEKEKQ